MFRNRGNIPDFGFNEDGTRDGYNVPYYRHRRYYVIVQYDKNFFIIEAIISAILLLIVLSAMLYTYKFPYFDPLKEKKEIFLNSQLICIIGTIGLIGISTMFSKKKIILLLNY